MNSESCVDQRFEHTEGWSCHFQIEKRNKSFSKCSKTYSEVGDVLWGKYCYGNIVLHWPTLQFIKLFVFLFLFT